jgi:spermidine synthase
VPVAEKKPVRSEPLSTGLQRFLYLTAAINGAAILIVEILGAKMLSPYFGTSHFVWTAQIAVTLLSLAVGYWFGGRLVDKSPDLRRLYWCMLIAALYLAATVPLVRPVSFARLKSGLATGSIVTALFLFFVPLTLLAVTGPFLVRVMIRSMDASGSVVGRISAISTFGSVAGTLLIAYVLIPLLPYSMTMFATAGLLAVLALVYHFGWASTNVKGPVAAAMLMLPVMVFGARTEVGGHIKGWNELARSNSDFGLLQVLEREDGGLRWYLNDLLLQNTYDPERKQSASLFTHMLHDLAEAYSPKLERVLCIGMGVGIVPMQFAREGRDVDVIEINPAIVPLAEAYFGFDSTLLNLNIGDGRQFVHTLPDAEYDAVILDAFLGDSSPSHLMTREAFADIHRVLKPDGVLVINSFCSFERGKDFMAASLDKTLKSVFENVVIHATGSGNVFYVAGDQSHLVMHRQPNIDDAHPQVRHSVRAALAGIMQPAATSGIVLTDDYNPVEYHDAANREEFRRGLANYMMNP